MQIWEVVGENLGNGADAVMNQATVYIQAPSEPHAREVARRLPISLASVRPIAGAEVPKGANVIPYDRSVAVDPIIRIAESPLIQRPVITIALGVVLGMLLSSCIFAIIAQMMGGSVRIGR